MSSVQVSGPVLLSEAGPGRYRCDRIEAVGQNAIRLKRLGICDGREFELIGHGDPMVLRIGESRIGLSRQLARTVSVSCCEPAE